MKIGMTTRILWREKKKKKYIFYYVWFSKEASTSSKLVNSKMIYNEFAIEKPK